MNCFSIPFGVHLFSAFLFQEMVSLSCHFFSAVPRDAHFFNLCLMPSIKSQVQADDSKSVWKNLKEKFGVASLPVIYSDFKRAMSFQLSGNNPCPEISMFMEHFDGLESNNVTISEFVKSMLFINVTLHHVCTSLGVSVLYLSPFTFRTAFT